MRNQLFKGEPAVVEHCALNGPQGIGDCRHTTALDTGEIVYRASTGRTNTLLHTALDHAASQWGGMMLGVETFDRFQVTA